MLKKNIRVAHGTAAHDFDCMIRLLKLTIIGQNTSMSVGIKIQKHNLYIYSKSASKALIDHNVGDFKLKKYSAKCFDL